MPKPMPFTQQQPIPSDSAPSGMRAIGVVRVVNRSLRFFIIFSSLACLVTILFGRLTLATPLGTIKLYNLNLVIFVIAAVAILLTARSLTLVVERPEKPFRLNLDRKHLDQLLSESRLAIKGSFRPQVIDEQGRVQLEFRKDWKGKDEWILFVPNEIVEEALEDYLRLHLPRMMPSLELY